MNVRYRVTLTQYERDELGMLLSGGKHPARRLKRAQILLAADAGSATRTSRRASGSAGRRSTGPSGVSSKATWTGAERRAATRSGTQAHRQGGSLLVATACSNPPAGRARWTLELLADAMVELTAHESLSRETVRRRLAENDLKPWRKDMWCIPQVDADYVARMEDVLDLYAEAPDPKRPVVCFDESPIQLIGEVRQPIPAKPGQIERYDYEYRRNGTANLFVFLDVNRPWRKVKVTERRAAKTSRPACASSPMFITLRRSGSGWCSTICRPIRPARSTRRSRPTKRDGCCAGWSSTTPPSTPVG